MQELHPNFVRFMKLSLNNYGVFKGSNVFVFDEHRTIITGAHGTGKTTIVNALANLGPVTGVERNIYSEVPEMSVDVVTTGDRNLIKSYKKLIFLDGHEPQMIMKNKEEVLSNILNNKDRVMIIDETKSIFRRLLVEKPHKIKLHSDLKPNLMAGGEHVCIGYAYIFAIRNVLGIDLPIVIDSPYGLLDPNLINGVREFLLEQSCQQILLSWDDEFTKEGEIQYNLK